MTNWPGCMAIALCVYCGVYGGVGANMYISCKFVSAFTPPFSRMVASNVVSIVNSVHISCVLHTS